MACKAGRIGHETHIVTGDLAESATGGLFFSQFAVESVASAYREAWIGIHSTELAGGYQMI